MENNSENDPNRFMPSSMSAGGDPQALTLHWTLGINKDVLGGVHNLSDSESSDMFYAAAHTGVIFDYNSGVQRLLQGHVNPISATAVSKDKKWIVTADTGPDSMMVVWERESGTPVKTFFNPHPYGVHALDIAPKLQYLVTLSAPAPASEPASQAQEPGSRANLCTDGEAAQERSKAVAKAAVVGIDLGASESYVAYVGKGIVDIVQNEVSKRATPTLVGFTDRERLLGDPALAQIRSNAKNTCRNVKHLLGQKLDSPLVEKEKFWSTCPLSSASDGLVGYDVTYKGEQRVFSTPQVTAMYLHKLREITESWCQAKVVDVVIGVPSYFSDVHRQALLDAAKIANMSVLRLMNEHTATALAWGIYRSNELDPEKPQTVAFCSMGHSIFSVSVVQFVKGKLNVLCEASDKVGGRDMDECLMRVFADQFKKKVGCDPLSNKKASFKLEDSVTKTKKILSANNEAGCACECLMEDEDFASNIQRADFEEMCKPMMDKVQAVLDKAKASMGVKVEEIDTIEIIGGSSRVPWVKKMCSEAFGGKELCTTMNADESVARGCALMAAMLSPLYKVRDFKVEDSSPYGINVGWMGSAADAEGAKEEDDGDTKMTGGEGEYKTATVFPAGSAMGLAKMLTFYRKGPFDLKAEYVDPGALAPGTSSELGTFRVELPASEDVKKVKVKAKLTLNGTFVIDGAQVIEEEEYEEVSKEKREIPAETSAEPPKEEPTPAPPAEETTSPAKEDAAPGASEAEPTEAPKPKEPEKKYEWVEVKKMKRRTKRTDIAISSVGYPGLSSAELQKRADEESAMQAEMREIIETDAMRNDLESYIFNMRDKTSSSGVYGEFITDANREKFHSDLTKAEDWLYDTEDATKVQYADKLEELKASGEPVVWRKSEYDMRGDWVKAVEGTISNYKVAAESPGEKYAHIAPEKLGKITTACMELQNWLLDMVAKQEKLPKTDKPVLLCADMEKKNQELAKISDEILKEPKPAPPKEEKKEDVKMETGDGDEAPKEESPANMDVD